MATQDQEQTRKKPILLRAWEKLGLDVPTVTKMVKFALPPTVALCICQSDTVLHAYGTVSYLVAVGAVLSSGMAPRAAYIEALISNVVFLGIAALVAIFAMWTVIKARETTSPPGSAPTAYNSSASAVAGVWLFFLLYVINSVKFTRPQFKFASVMSSILATITMTYAPQFPNMASALNMVRSLYGALMSGIAITTVISLLFNPTSCRQVVFADIETYITQLRALLESERKYMTSLELQNPFRSHEEGENVLEKVQALRSAHGKLFADMGSAKKEIAYGRLLPSDLSEIQRILRRIFLPAVGISSIISIFQRLALHHGWTSAETDVETASEHHLSMEYQDIMKSLDKPMNRLLDVLGDAYDHVLYRLRLRGWKKVRDSLRAEESGSNYDSKPGHDTFVRHLEDEVDLFYRTRIEILRTWCEHHNIKLAPDSFESDFTWITNSGETLFGTPMQRQLFVVLYIEFLLWSAARSTLSLVRFADSKVKDGTMLKKRLILPGRKTVLKWINTFGRSDNDDSLDSQGMNRSTADTTRTLWTDTFKGFRKDPEHLPMTNPLQNIGRFLRAFGKMLRSHHSQFGFRLACGAMSIEIIALLSDTQVFFVEQRLFWATIMVAVSMTRTSGEASFIYFLRMCGTFIGAVFCYIMYYIVNGHTAGVLFFYFISIAMFGYFPAKKPRLSLAAVIGTITSTIVIGYELQVQKTGTNYGTGIKPIYYPIYLLAPFRFATTIAGIFVSYIFTIFPFPISEGSEIRKDLGVALYTLASHYSLVQETVTANITGEHGDLSIRTSPGRKLERARVKLMAKQMLLLQSMRAQLSFTIWQFPLDAPFPKERYDKIIDLIENIVNFTALIGYASTSLNLTEEEAKPETLEWHQSFRILQDSVQQTSDEITSLLCLLSSSILYAQPLPPHLHVPAPYSLLQRMQATNRHILDISHVAEKGYSAFAVLQIASRSIILDLYELVDHIRELVGQLDFSKPYSSTSLSRYTTSKSKQY
ncbi:uncharacterized protein PV09_01683 [Verruconis gallopava]|uniref:ER transporter 6TM N-terminal domain-containing protein n=1 Tax=Verruconis gallopava TaxID=253628 RepID=A0A0D2B922_9PEZI|nr:uncharacterized protein PV09_01683 [Verruconis gallopava]KIW07754.1 hypothetical protein PV09_01683 [Verruconis gallopava]